MRDPELMLSLLREMSEGKDKMGRLIIPMTFDMDERQQQRHHHMELLVDAGHAQWTNDDHHIARITNAGYDFLNAATNPTHGEKVWSRFIDTFNSGVSYARAAEAAMEFVTKLAGV